MSCIAAAVFVALTAGCGGGASSDVDAQAAAAASDPSNPALVAEAGARSRTSTTVPKPGNGSGSTTGGSGTTDSGGGGTTTTTTTNPGGGTVSGMDSLRPLPATRVAVASETELRSAVARANSTGGNVTIVLADGVYALADTLYVNAPNVALVSASNDRSKVTLHGDAMSANSAVKNLIRVTGKAFQLRALSLERAGWHLIQIVGEADADDPIIADCAMRDSWEQMLKVTYDSTNPALGSDRGIVQNCVFEYSAGIGPQYYIGGIDAHAATDWVVRGNTFRYIASPSRTLAEPAVHFWSNSRNTLVERNVIVDSDRGIGFGLGDRGHVGGVIRNNFIHHTANAHPFADAGIVLENSSGTGVYNNTLLLEHSYPRAIEYRFAGTSGGTIANNLSNRAIASRDGGTATLRTNIDSATRATFRLTSVGDLRLAAPTAGIVDAATAISGLVNDLDGEARPKGAGIDIGADEY
jgi:hypothetical protein